MPMKTINIRDFDHSPITEKEIIQRILSGEKELYEILIRRNNQKMYRVVKSYINEETEIEDVMQNTYLKAYEKLYQFKLASKFSTWLIRIGINEALARIKQKGKIRHLNDSYQNTPKETILEIPDKNHLNPEKTVIRNETKQLLEKTIDSLDSKYKAVYILREIEEMTINEISICLDIKISTTKVRLHRAKNILRETLYELTLNKDLFEFGFGRCDKVTIHVINQL